MPFEPCPDPLLLQSVSLQFYGMSRKFRAISRLLSPASIVVGLNIAFESQARKQDAPPKLCSLHINQPQFTTRRAGATPNCGLIPHISPRLTPPNTLGLTNMGSTFTGLPLVAFPRHFFPPVWRPTKIRYPRGRPRGRSPGSTPWRPRRRCGGSPSRGPCRPQTNPRETVRWFPMVPVG